MPSAYDPTAISFGPYHHGKEELKAMEDAKGKYIHSLLNRNNKTLEAYLELLRTIKDDAKACYQDLPEIDDEQFVNIMTRDGCVLVEVMNRLISDVERPKLDWEEIDPILVEMMLLENQIPFIVLEKIWQVQQKDTSLRDQVLWLMRDIYSPNPDDSFPVTARPIHLLHLLGLVAFPDDDKSSSRQPPASGQELISCLSNLLERGVELKKNEQARGLEVSFSNGFITMNPLKITGDTNKFFGNLIAFEQYYNGATLNASSYVVLMNSLFQDSADVAALSSDNRGILEHKATHVDVAVLFKTLRLGVHDFKVDQCCTRRAVFDWLRNPEKPSSTIFRVPAHIRDLTPNAYEPTIISFGPYHHGKERLKAMQRQKWQYLDDLLEGFQGKNWEGCLGAVRKIKVEARRSYQELSGLGDDAEFVKVMTLDGCFQIEFMTRIFSEKKHDKIDWNIVHAVQRDIMLLENQIPFIVLHQLSQYLDPHLDLSPLEKNFLKFVKDIYSPNSETPAFDSEGPLHLVDLLRREMFPTGAPAQASGGGESNSRVCDIPGLAQLKRKGAKIVRRQGRGLKVSFENGKMGINCHKINRNTEVYLQNLIAFEQGYLPAGLEASSYAVLMNYLIGSPEDVAVLSSIETGILDNNLTTEEVVHLFQNLCMGIDCFHGGKIYEDISKYFSSRSRQWMRELRETYFNSPWSYVAFFAAAALLAFTITQTAYAIKAYNLSLT